MESYDPLRKMFDMDMDDCRANLCLIQRLWRSIGVIWSQSLGRHICDYVHHVIESAFNPIQVLIFCVSRVSVGKSIGRELGIQYVVLVGV